RYRLRVLPEFYQLADISPAFLELAAHYSTDSHQVQAGHFQRWIAELLCDLVKTSGVGRRLGKLRLHQVIRLKTEQDREDLISVAQLFAQLQSSAISPARRRSGVAINLHRCGADGVL